MNKNIKKISIIGDGSWGTTLAIHLASKGFPVVVWSAFQDYANQMQKTRTNPRYLPGIKIPASVIITHDLSLAIDHADLLVLAMPSQYTKRILHKIKHCAYQKKSFLSVVKGLEGRRLLRISELIHDVLGQVPLAVLSGPTIALEVAHQIPSSAVIASRDQGLAKVLQKIFHSSSFRIYTNSDMIGVELGGSIKNVIAIACGICDGLGFGANTKAAILSRGLAEMARLGEALKARKKTFFGLSGLGDLATTCFSVHSRNRQVGECLGRGQTLQSITAGMTSVAEGILTAKAIYRLSLRHHVSMPITQEIFRVLYRNKDPRKAVYDLMVRQLKAE